MVSYENDLDESQDTDLKEQPENSKELKTFLKGKNKHPNELKEGGKK